ncbi:hypothetical protein G8770_16215 [Aestuariicella hydrocarbonica]|uniref:Galactose oxidase n=1 Tax=Pseudomaricurvus hydrocarbonicus TaxID=1470433 RepID=A0A9E5MMQ7_9GAMM|nr:kelch repeat-containing protein [Aestuariicella hydrocarbonica]NHO67093.1 hypothetical protein [Aestuariicella hydrocarbonica]
MAWIMTGQSWRYEIASDSWSLLTEAPEVHGESVSLLVDDTIHVIGGRTPKAERNTGWFDHRSSDRHLILDTSAGHWFQAAPAPTARNSAAGGVLNGDLYVAGGRSDTGVNLDTLEVYDVKEERWRTATPMPQAQGGLAATVIDNQLMVFGGEHFGADGVRVYAEAWRYEPSKDRWFTEQPMLTPRHGLGAVAYGGCAYAIGGATGIATNGTSAKLEAIQLNFN